MGCSCTQASIEGGSGTGGDNNMDTESTIIGENADGSAENQDCYMQRAGDPKASSAGEPVSKDTNKDKITPEQLVYGKAGEQGYFEVSTILVDSTTNKIDIHFKINNQSKPVGVWTYNWLSYTGLIKPSASFKSFDNNNYIEVEGTLPSSTIQLEVLAYEGVFNGTDVVVVEGVECNLPLIDKQTFTINAISKNKNKTLPITINVPTKNIPVILARYGITSGIPNTVAGSEYGSKVYDRVHTGVDLEAVGEVIAAADGVVVDTGWSDSYGWYVLMRHNGIKKDEKIYAYTLYATITNIKVKKDINKVISTGTILGTTSNSGLESDDNIELPDQIHFEIRRSSQRVEALVAMTEFNTIDPLSVINGAIKNEVKDIIVFKNENKSYTLSSSDNDQVSVPCSPGTVSYAPRDGQSFGNEIIKVDSNIVANSVTEGMFLALMNAEVIYNYPQLYHNSDHTIKGCPGGTPMNGPFVVGKKSGLWSCKTKLGTPCGWNLTQNDRGGETKFGISTNGNPGLNMNALTRDGAMQVMWNKYYKGAKIDIVSNKYVGCICNAQHYQGPAIFAKTIKQMINSIGISSSKGKGVTTKDMEGLNVYISKYGAKATGNTIINTFFSIWGAAAVGQSRVSTLKTWCNNYFPVDS